MSKTKAPTTRFKLFKDLIHTRRRRASWLKFLTQQTKTVFRLKVNDDYTQWATLFFNKLFQGIHCLHPCRCLKKIWELWQSLKLLTQPVGSTFYKSFSIKHKLWTLKLFLKLPVQAKVDPEHHDLELAQLQDPEPQHQGPEQHRLPRPDQVRLHPQQDHQLAADFLLKGDKI